MRRLQNLVTADVNLQQPVAQISNLLYRRISFGRSLDSSEAQVLPTASGLEIRDTAGWKPALPRLDTRHALAGSEFVSEAVPRAKKDWLSVAAELFRARLTALVLLTTVVGFYLGAAAPLDWLRLLETLVGTALVAAAASALNQWWEREPDARMQRTQERPLPTGRLRPATVLIGGLASAAVGLLVLALTINVLTSVLGLISLAVYVLIYTPLKRRTWLNTSVGTISGAMPALMGWTAARGQLSLEGWALFAILVLWQLPHFLAIAWIYRDQYAHAGFRMLSACDPDGRRSGRQAVGFTLGLLLCSLAPFALRLTGPVYGCGALLLGLGFLVCAIRFRQEATLPRARQLFRASIWYMSLLLLLLVADKIN